MMAAEDSKIKVLYIDDEEHNLMSFMATLRMDFKVFTAINANIGRDILEREGDIGVIISDQRMPDENGVEFFSSTLDSYPDCARILLTGFTDVEAVIEAINKGHVFMYMKKPWNAEELNLIIRQGHERYNLKKENKRLTDELKRINKQLEFLYRQTLIS